VAYDAAVRVWYGPESYQHALWRKPTGHTIGVTAPKPCIVYRPGGGWAGADVADLESRGWWYYSLNDATSGYDSTYQVFVLNTASVGYNRAKVTGLTAWVNTTAYALGDYRGHGGRLWVCIDAHTSVLVDNEPGVGATWETKWREIGRNETGQRQVADLGECTPGGLDEAVGNVQQFIGWLRRNAATYGVNPDQICVAGASAGGQLAGCVAYAESIPWAKDSQIYGAARDAFYTSTQPNAALLSITPVDLVRHTTYSLLNGLYGEDASDAVWVAREAAIKRAMSPLYVLKRTGLAIPTCLDFVAAGSHTAGTAFTGLTGSPYHHPDNGWLMLQYLNAARPTGLAQSGHIFFDDASAGVYRYYTAFGGAATSAGTSGDPQEAAELMIAWLNAALGV
jgi:hypothetical protein